MGARTGYRVVHIGDHFILPHHFRTQTVEFRIGSELHALNLLLSAMGADSLSYGGITGYP